LHFEQVGDVIKANDVIGEVYSVTSVRKVCSPVAGKVVDVNSAKLDDYPAIINESAEEEGWMIKLEVENNLMEKEDYIKYCDEKEH